jgi:hypothetical protein
LWQDRLLAGLVIVIVAAVLYWYRRWGCLTREVSCWCMVKQVDVLDSGIMLNGLGLWLLVIFEALFDGRV